MENENAPYREQMSIQEIIWRVKTLEQETRYISTLIMRSKHLKKMTKIHYWVAIGAFMSGAGFGLTYYLLWLCQ